MKKMSYLILLFCPALLNGSWVKNYWYGYRAASAMEAKNYTAAGDFYTKALSSDPYDSQANYNMGLALYGQKKYDSAANYFERSATHAKQNLKLKEQSLFNLGDAQVHDKKLHEALASFGKVIDLNPKNDRARHNLEYVKQLLAKEAQERPKQDPKDPQNSKDQKDQKDQQDDSNKQPKGESRDQEKSPKEDGQKFEKSESDGQKSDKQEDLQQKSGDDLNDEKKDKEDVSKDLKKSEEKSNEEKSKPEGKQDEKSKSDESKNEAVSEGSGLTNEHQAEVMQKPEDDKRLDKRAVMVMQEMQKQEDNIQKQLLKMNVSKQGAFGHGQKNW